MMSIVGKFTKVVFYLGLFLLPLIFWPWVEIPYEIPKVWFFQRWVEILGFLGILGILKGQVKERKNNSWLVFFIFFFVLLAAISSFLGVDKLKSVWGNYYRGDGLLTLFHLAGLFFFLVLFWEKDWEKATAWAIVGGSILVSFWTIFVGVLGELGVVGVIGGSRFGEAVGATFGNPNFLAGYLLVSLPFTVYCLRGLGVLRVLGILGQVGAIFLTGSRAAILGVLFLGIAWVWGKAGKWWKLGILGIVGLLVVSGVLGLKKELRVSEGMYFFPESRSRIVVRGVIAFTRKPLFGWGWTNFDYAFESVDWPIKYEKDVYVDKAHSNLLEVLVTNGIAGLSIYITIIVLTLKKLITKTGKNEWYKTLLAVFLLFLFHSQTNIISINEEMFFWLIAGIASAST